MNRSEMIERLEKLCSGIFAEVMKIEQLKKDSKASENMLNKWFLLSKIVTDKNYAKEHFERFTDDTLEENVKELEEVLVAVHTILLFVGKSRSGSVI